jgi:exo-beta-1,3-glucanase (GH17 family)
MAEFEIFNKFWQMTARTLVPVICAALLASCGGGDGHTGQSSQQSNNGSYSLALRQLPAIYGQNTKATNYSPYRAGGPGAGEVPTDAQILQDLQLLNSVGFTLLRIFDSDLAHENILRVAASNFPNLKFHLGIYLQGIATNSQSTCSNTANDTDIQNGIRLAKTYSNVVTVSVGNETSFFSAYMPINCLRGYITTVKSNIPQPVTADDDYRLYAGIAGEAPDSILPLLDFVSMHTYPMSNYGNWNWQQTTVTTGQTRAVAMMNASLANAQSTYTQVANYISAHGAATNLPIVIGETGWKHVQTNTGNPLETVAATPINAKWYFDLMNTWQSGGTGPKTIFWFEATDEAWKGTDDGWGLWNTNRAPLYALCGTSAAGATACASPDPYAGAGYYP